MAKKEQTIHTESWPLRVVKRVAGAMDKWEAEHLQSAYSIYMQSRFRDIKRQVEVGVQESEGYNWLEFDHRLKALFYEVAPRVANLVWNVVGVVPWFHEKARSPFYELAKSRAQQPDLVGLEAQDGAKISFKITSAGWARMKL